MQNILFIIHSAPYGGWKLKVLIFYFSQKKNPATSAGSFLLILLQLSSFEQIQLIQLNIARDYLNFAQ